MSFSIGLTRQTPSLSAYCRGGKPRQISSKTLQRQLAARAPTALGRHPTM
jgi:hypothetical protein